MREEGLRDEVPRCPPAPELMVGEERIWVGTVGRVVFGLLVGHRTVDAEEAAISGEEGEREVKHQRIDDV